MKFHLMLGLVASLVIQAPAFAQDTAQQGPTGAAQPFKLGALDLVALRDADFALPNDAKTFGVDAGSAAVAEVLRSANRPTDKITVSIDALLVKTHGRRVLIDTGLGNPSASGLILSLKLAGVAPDQITDVLITHTHGDHVGGLVTADHKPAFPNAKVRMSAKEWAWMQSQAGAKTISAVIAPQVETFEPGQVVAPGIRSVAIEGHTPGHVGYEIVSGRARLLDIGDTAHSSVVSLAKPDWIMGFDSDPAVAKASRRATLTRLAKSHELIFAPHFPFPGVGRVEAAGDGFVWRPGLN
jgi:glyoxylase-like metal-dependent hydrolase (beta-lactamase superfamily II)